MCSKFAFALGACAICIMLYVILVIYVGHVIVI